MSDEPSSQRWADTAHRYRLESRIAQLERKNWERSDFAFRLIMHGLMAATVVLAVAAIAVAAYPPH